MPRRSRRGEVQAQLLEVLDPGSGTEPDPALAARLVTRPAAARVNPRHRRQLVAVGVAHAPDHWCRDRRN